MVRIQKILKRRELLAQIEFELETKNDTQAVELYKDVIQISYALEEFDRAEKYTQIRTELKKTLPSSG